MLAYLVLESRSKGPARSIEEGSCGALLACCDSLIRSVCIHSFYMYYYEVFFFLSYSPLPIYHFRLYIHPGVRMPHQAGCSVARWIGEEIGRGIYITSQTLKCSTQTLLRQLYMVLHRPSGYYYQFFLCVYVCVLFFLSLLIYLLLLFRISLKKMSTSPLDRRMHKELRFTKSRSVLLCTSMYQPPREEGSSPGSGSRRILFLSSGASASPSEGIASWLTARERMFGRDRGILKDEGTARQVWDSNSPHDGGCRL
eukprot:gene4828-3467_t